MPRVSKTRENVHRPREADRNGFHHLEVLSIVSRYFCQGHPPSQIVKLIKKDYDIELRREEPWIMLGFAASRGWFHFSPPFELEFRGHIRHRYGLEVDVVRSAEPDDVSRRGAEALLRFVKSRAAAGHKVVHIGFAGGSALKKTARFLAELLRRETGKLPKQIVFHAMVAGFNLENPTSDPNAFFSYFDAETMPVATRFVGLPTLSLLSTKETKAFSGVKLIQKALKRKHELDIIVTSAGGHWQEEHSGLSRAYSELASKLNTEDWIGDMMWQPLAKHGPVDIAHIEPRALTLLTLRELAGFVAREKKVLLILGPCRQCREPKSEVLQAILNWESRIVTDLILDSRTARELVASTT